MILAKSKQMIYVPSNTTKSDLRVLKTSQVLAS